MADLSMASVAEPSFKTDAQRAAEYKAKLVPLVDQCCEILTDVRRDRMQVNLQITYDGFGRARYTLEFIKVIL